ncbi:MAG TPA: PIN domain-containing protein [Thermomicrobiales bacterium]|jgi:predicted nucleic acid-binding protein
MMPLPFLDTNILLRHITGDEPNHSPRATAFLRRIEQGDVTVRTADTVVFETVYALQRVYRMPRQGIRDAVLPLLALPGIKLPGKASYRYAFDLYANQPGLSFGDCFHLALMKRLRLSDMLTFDRKIGRVPGITRVEPT